MNSDLEIIKAVIEEIHSNRNIKFFSKHFSPDFVYDCPFSGQMNFDDYCKQIVFITAMSEVKTTNVKYVGCCYEVTTDFILLDTSRNKKFDLKFKFDYFITDGIITKKIGHCNPTAEQREFIATTTYHLQATK